jgi:hypothetical protein
MKRIILTIMVFAFFANVSAQLKVNSTGQVGIGTTNPLYKLDVTGDTRVNGGIYLGSTPNILGTTNNVPITFKVNGVLAGSTGNDSTVSNVSFGYRALSSNTTGNYNTANGMRALHYNTTGYSNTASGDMSLYSNETGINNTANGVATLYRNETGNNNTAIGCYANVNASNLSNITVIGYNAWATSSNQVRIGNSSVTSIGGYAAWTNLSDGRTNKNIRTDVPGLTFINQLQPITYNLDLDAIDGLLKIDRIKRPDEDELSPELIEINKKARAAKEKQIQTGFIAQDVEKIAKSIGYDFSGVDVDEIGIYGLRYAEFVVPLVKAVQELSAQVTELTALVNSLQGKDADPALLKSGNAVEAATGLQELTGNGVSLQQNIPNPFSQTTVIRYILPQTCNSALIVISNTAGNIIRQIPLSVSDGTNSITIEGRALSAGIYYYSLYVDNKLIDTKQMILTK